MQMALDLAEKARGATSPNPLVGCVIVSPDGHVVGKGYHHKAGEPHAEINAMDDAGEKTAGATAYVTLEPCSHYGRTGPCCEALIKAGIKKCCRGTDPNPRVSGRGFRRLEEAGVEVVSGVLADKAYRQNEIFMHYMKTGRPFVALKYAMTLDGKIATVSGDSKWITGVKARTYAHRLRSWYDAILVGRETVAQDDPSLTVRLVEGKIPCVSSLTARRPFPWNVRSLRMGRQTRFLSSRRRPFRKRSGPLLTCRVFRSSRLRKGTGMWIFLTSCSNLPKRCDQRPCRRRQRYPWSFL